MRLGINYHQNKYLVKLGKLEAGIDGSVIDQKKETLPSLIIYQSMKIANNKASMGIVSKLPPRIINAFI